MFLLRYVDGCTIQNDVDGWAIQSDIVSRGHMYSMRLCRLYPISERSRSSLRARDFARLEPPFRGSSWNLGTSAAGRANAKPFFILKKPTHPKRLFHSEEKPMLSRLEGRTCATSTSSTWPGTSSGAPAPSDASQRVAGGDDVDKLNLS